MRTQQQFLEEIRRLESSLAVLSIAAQHMPKTAPEADFYLSEVPLAIEDAQEGIQRLISLLDLPPDGGSSLSP